MSDTDIRAMAEEAKRLAEDMADAACACEAGEFVQRQREPLHAAIDRLAAVAEERQSLMKLAKFGAAMLHWHRGDNPGEVGDVDAFTCQDEAVDCGVLEARNVDGPCCESCECAPFDGWDVCYFVPDDVRATIKRLKSDAAASIATMAGKGME